MSKASINSTRDCNRLSLTSYARRQTVLSKIQTIAIRAVNGKDCWERHKIEDINAERVIRYTFIPNSGSWKATETICKIEKDPFTSGAMRHCYRMKMIDIVTLSNVRFKWNGWKKASNYVAKCYLIKGSNKIDTSSKARANVFKDVEIQYEAQVWANKFNDLQVPRKIIFLKALVIEFPNREGSPVFAVERFISGKDEFGASFVKHNSNSGYVNPEYERQTPQVFSAYSFYASKGTRLVSDIQGVGDLFTDPQILSDDDRYGDGDLGTRGMALFFTSFSHTELADSIGIPMFPLSRNELKHLSLCDECKNDDDEKINCVEDKLIQMDLNRIRRSSLFVINDITETTSNALNRSVNINKSFAKSILETRPIWHRSKSDLDEISQCFRIAMTKFEYDHTAFHRLPSGDLIGQTQLNPNDMTHLKYHRRGTVMEKTLMPLVPDSTTRKNLGEVHYQVACLHGSSCFEDISSNQDAFSHDVYSVLFHLAVACAHDHTLACLALARVKSGFRTSVSDLLSTIVPINFDDASRLLWRVIDNDSDQYMGKAAAACLLIHIQHEQHVQCEERLHLLDQAISFRQQADAFKDKKKTPRDDVIIQNHQHIFLVGDRVQANYAMEGTFYPGVVIEVTDTYITVQYDDDESTESLTFDHVQTLKESAKSLTDTSEQTILTDDIFRDDSCLFQMYELKGKKADFLVEKNNYSAAAALYEEAANLALSKHDYSAASEWSTKAMNYRDLCEINELK